MGSWQTVTVGVKSLDEALALWRDTFGMHEVSARDGADPGLAAVWDIAASDIHRQALLATNDHRIGMLHLVEFDNPLPPVRDNAQVFDWVPKNLDIYVEDMPARIAELKAAGQTFRAEHFSEVTAPDGTRFREIHMPTHDAINVVLLEMLDEKPPMTAHHYGAIGPLITIVPDAATEKAFLRSVLVLDKLKDNILDGPEIEAMIGLPRGAALDVSIWGATDQSLGWLEIIEYRGTEGANLYPRAKPKATGILQVRYALDDLATLRVRLQQNDIEYQTFADADLIDGSGELMVFYSPAGLRIEAMQR